MVDQNYILYVNDKKQLRQSKIALNNLEGNINFKFSVSEKHLFCGLILNGMPVKGAFLKDFPFSPIEKYLFEFTNVFFIIPEMEYRHENIAYDFNILGVNLPSLEFPPPPLFNVQLFESVFEGESVRIRFGSTLAGTLSVAFFNEPNIVPLTFELQNLFYNDMYLKYEKESFVLPRNLFDEGNIIISPTAKFMFVDVATQQLIEKTFAELFY